MKKLLTVLLLTLSFSCSQTVPRPVNRADVAENFKVASYALVGLVDGLDRIYCGGVMYKDYVLTAEHCVDDTDNVYIGLYGDYKSVINLYTGIYPAKKVYADPVQDLAILEPKNRLPKQSYLNLTLAPKGHLGERVFLLGHPRGLGYSFSEGRLMAEKRQGLAGSNMAWLQISAPAYPGNSGGACLNDDGEILGITSFIWRGENHLTGCVHMDSIRGALKSMGIE